MKFKKIVSFILMLTCMLCIGLSFGVSNATTSNAQTATSSELGTPDVEFVRIHTDNNNSVWGGPTRAVRLVFSKNFTAQAYDGNEGGFDSPIIASVRPFVKINGQSLGNVTFVQIPNEDSITFLYDESLLAVPAGQEYTEFTIEAGAPFGGHYLPAVTLYFDDGSWCEKKPVIENVTITNIHNRNGGDQRLLLFISNSDYENSNANISAKVANSSLLDYVNVYTSKTEYKTLREIYQGNAQSKIWGEANSIGFQIDANYHGTAVYAVEIKKGAKFPASANNYTKYVVSEDVICYNDSYQGDSSANGWAVSWRVITQKSVTVTNIHNRKGADRRLLLFISNSDYADSNADITAKVANTNLLDCVNVYMSKTEYKTLREIYQGNAQSKIWGEANSIAFSIDDNYHGTAVYAVEIKKGAQFPASTNDNTTYVVSADVVYYNVSYKSTEASYKDNSSTWTTEKPVEPEIPVEPEVPTLGTPDVEFVEIHNDNNNSVWGGSTRAVRLVFSQNFTAQAYDGNEGGFDSPVIASVRPFVKINGQSLGDLTFVQIPNENSITFLYDESLLAVPEGQEYTLFTIEAGAPFGGHYLPAVTLYYDADDGVWSATEPVPDPDPVTENVTVTNIHNRKGDGQKLLLFISNNDYTVGNFDITAKIANVNVLDFVNVYTSKTEFVTLREIYGDNATSFIWGEANSIAFAIDANYHGTAVYAVEIKKGAQFPASTNDYTTYVVSADVVYYNVNYKSTDTAINDLSSTWTTEKPVEPEVPTLGTPDVDFCGIHSDNNNSVWGGSTRAVRLVFSQNFTAQAYDGNEGKFDSPIIASVRPFVKINGQLLGDLTFVQISNENSITFLYDASLLTVLRGEKQTKFTIEAGAPFGGHYLPEVTLYFNGDNWQTEETIVKEKFLGVVDGQNNVDWEGQKAVKIAFNYTFDNVSNAVDGKNLISKLTFNGLPVTDSEVLVDANNIGENTITIIYSKDMLDRALEPGLRYYTLSLTESVNYLGVQIPAFTMYLRRDAWTLEYPELVELNDVEAVVKFDQEKSIVHIRDWNLDGDESTAVNNMILFFLPDCVFPEGHNLFANLDKVLEYNVFDKIKFHMITPNAEADENGFVTLGQVFNAGGWYPSELSGGKDKIVVFNMWESVSTVAFSMGAQYTAVSFDYIIIEEGCEFPNYYYTNGSDNKDYLQNGEYVEYKNAKRVSYIQAETVKIFTNPKDFTGPSKNTNWGIDNNMGEVTVSGVDYQDGFVIIKVEGSNYPTSGDHLNVSAGNDPMALNMLEEIYVNGISLYDRVVNFGANGITAYFNYNGYGNFAISVVLKDANEVVTEIIVTKSLKVPTYGMSQLGAEAYGVMYTEANETASYTKGANGFVKDEKIYWTISFDDGKTVTKVRVADGEMLSADAIPNTPTKEGFEFNAWVYGIDGIYSFEPTSPIKRSYYLTASWTESADDPVGGDSTAEEGGCMSSIGSLDVVVSLLLLVAGGMLLIKKKRA